MLLSIKEYAFDNSNLSKLVAWKAIMMWLSDKRCLNKQKAIDRYTYFKKYELQVETEFGKYWSLDSREIFSLSNDELLYLLSPVKSEFKNFKLVVSNTTNGI